MSALAVMPGRSVLVSLGDRDLDLELGLLVLLLLPVPGRPTLALLAISYTIAGQLFAEQRVDLDLRLLPDLDVD